MVEYDPAVGVIGRAFDLHLVRVSVLEWSQRVDDPLPVLRSNAEWYIVMVDGLVFDDGEGRLGQVDVVLVEDKEANEVLVGLDSTW